MDALPLPATLDWLTNAGGGVTLQRIELPLRSIRSHRFQALPLAVD
jgi:hypothetical protein